MADDPLVGYEEIDDPEFEKKFERKPQFNQAQYDLLKWCSNAEDMTVWNKWRENYLLEEVWLEGAKLRNARLKGANMRSAHLEGAILWEAHLEKAHLELTQLQRVNLQYAHLEGAYLTGAQLEGAYFHMAFVDGSTAFDDCTVDKNTDFNGVGMGSCRMPAGLRDTLEYNIRRRRCWEGSVGRKILNAPINAFWTLSDYGRSTGRIALWFFLLSLLFAFIYDFSERHGNSLVESLSTADAYANPWLPPCRAVYFSVVTMTTLGFGDMNANPESIPGHIILTIQVLLGYLLLGALICRFGIHFQSVGPPVKLSPTWKPPKKKHEPEA